MDILKLLERLFPYKVKLIGKEKLQRRLLKVFTIQLCFLLIFQMTSCGWIIYPERRHSTVQLNPSERRIDPAVAVLDGIGLVFFIIPGLVAFAVDFGTGAIYMPSDRRAYFKSSEKWKEIAIKKIIYPKPDKMLSLTLEQIVKRETGAIICFSNPKMHAYSLDHIKDLDKMLVQTRMHPVSDRYLQ